MSGAADASERNDCEVMEEMLEFVCTNLRKPKIGKAVRRIGEGTFGKVFEVRSAETGQAFAIKACRCPNGEDYEFIHYLMDECRLMKMLEQDASKHENLMPAHDCFGLPEDDTVLIVMPYMPGGCLESFIFNPEFSRTPEIKKANLMMFTRQLLEGLNHLHNMGWAHRDLTTRNVVLDQTFQKLKICDFGVSCELTNQQARISKTTDQPGYTCEGICALPFRAVELLLGDNLYDPAKADVWSLAMIVARMIQKASLFYDGRSLGPNGWEELHLVTKIKMFQLLGTPTETSWPGVTRLPGYVSDPLFPCWTAENFEALWKQWDVPCPILGVLARSMVLYPRRRATAAELIMQMTSLEAQFGLKEAFGDPV